MKRVLALTFIAIFGLAALRLNNVRSVSVALADTGYDLTYTVAWGWGMDEKVTFFSDARIWPAWSSGWVEIFDKPYDSGVSLYRSSDGRTYYLGTLFGLHIFEPSTGTVRPTCSPADVQYTSLGRELSNAEYPITDQIDPDGRRLASFVERGEQVPFLVTPIDSRYYEGLKYLGRFGVAKYGHRGVGRGDGVAFASSEKSPEPRLSLNICNY